jgi:hypothetical protein
MGRVLRWYNGKWGPYSLVLWCYTGAVILSGASAGVWPDRSQPFTRIPGGIGTGNYLL